MLLSFFVAVTFKKHLPIFCSKTGYRFLVFTRTYQPVFFACACLLTSFVLGLANSCAMQLITEIPSDFAARFAAMCSSGVESQLAVARPLNLKDSARFLVEEVLSGFPGLVSTDSLEVSAHRVSLLPHSWNASYERFCRH